MNIFNSLTFFLGGKIHQLTVSSGNCFLRWAFRIDSERFRSAAFSWMLWTGVWHELTGCQLPATQQWRQRRMTAPHRRVSADLSSCLCRRWMTLQPGASGNIPIATSPSSFLFATSGDLWMTAPGFKSGLSSVSNSSTITTCWNGRICYERRKVTEANV